MQPYRVHIVEDDHSLRASLREVLAQAGYQVQDWAGAEPFLEDLSDGAPAVLVCDMRMPGMSGVELHAELLRRGRSLSVVYISGESTVPQCIEAMKLGAIEFLLKPFSRFRLLAAVARGIERERVREQQAIELRSREESIRNLAPREREVLALLLEGHNNTELVAALGISLATAKQYKAQVMRKMGAKSLAELMRLATMR